MVSVTVRVQIASDATKDAMSRANGPLKEVLENVLGKLRFIGPRLLSMNLHFFPLAEWTLGGELNVAIFKGTISLTFKAE